MDCTIPEKTEWEWHSWGTPRRSPAPDNHMGCFLVSGCWLKGHLCSEAFFDSTTEFFSHHPVSSYPSQVLLHFTTLCLLIALITTSYTTHFVIALYHHHFIYNTFYLCILFIFCLPKYGTEPHEVRDFCLFYSLLHCQNLELCLVGAQQIIPKD